MEFSYSENENTISIKTNRKIDHQDFLIRINNINHQLLNNQEVNVMIDYGDLKLDLAENFYQITVDTISLLNLKYTKVNIAAIISSPIATAMSLLCEKDFNGKFSYKTFSTIEGAKSWLKVSN